jgi:hypothetical protein
LGIVVKSSCKNAEEDYPKTLVVCHVHLHFAVGCGDFVFGSSRGPLPRGNQDIDPSLHECTSYQAICAARSAAFRLSQPAARPAGLQLETRSKAELPSALHDASAFRFSFQPIEPLGRRRAPCRPKRQRSRCNLPKPPPERGDAGGGEGQTRWCFHGFLQQSAHCDRTR